MGCNSIVRTVTLYGMHGTGIKSQWGKIFSTSPDQSWGPPSHLYNGSQVSLSAVGAEVKERVEIYLYLPYGPSWPVIG